MRNTSWRMAGLLCLWAGLLLMPLSAVAQNPRAWGVDRLGQPGSGSYNPSDVPVQVSTPTGFADVTAIAGGGSPAPAIALSCPPITLSPSSLPGGALAVAYSQTITASGGTAPYTFAITSGSLPPGLGLNASTGVVSGTPAAAGSFPFTVTATDASGGADGSLGCSGSQPYTLVIACPTITLSPSSLLGGTLGVAYSQTIAASGGTAPYTFSVNSSSLPPGLGLNGSTGVLSGTPAAAGSFAFTITAIDARGCWRSQLYVLAITCPTITLSPSSLMGGTVGATFSQAIAASGGTAPYSFAVTSGSLPAGLGLNGSTGVLSGTPTAAGSFSFTITAADARGCSGAHPYTLVITCPAITLSPTSLPNGTVAAAYSQTITASGGTAPYSFAVTSGSLPAGLGLNGSTGVLSGTPAMVGSSSFTITATDTRGCSGAYPYTLVITCPAITLSPSSLPNGTVVASYSQTIAASGGTAPYTFAVTIGGLPAGLGLSASTGVLSGTPTMGGSFPFTITATDATGCAGAQPYTLVIACPTITLSPSSLPGGAMAVAYSQTVTASGGAAPYTLAITGGSLPAGLNLNGSTGVISGTPSTSGSFPFTITAVDATGCLGAHPYTLVIACPTITLSPSSLPGGTMASAYSLTFTASGGTAPYSFAVTGGSLPGGLGLNGSTGVLSGTPAAAGTSPFTVTATDAQGCSGSQPYTLVIAPCTNPPVWQGTSPMAAPRQGHTATLLPGGKVLVAGGNGSSNPASALASAALYNPATGAWSPTGAMAVGRGNHKAMLLPNGKVLVAGGLDTGAMPLASAEIYDPVAGTWSVTGSMTTPRYYHTMTLLPTGKVLVAGGSGLSGNLSSAEVYNPSMGTWSPTVAMSSARINHTATLLPTGKVLVAGGMGSSGALASALIYDAVAGTWSATAFMVAARAGHTATLLSTGKVLVSGGLGSSGLLASAEIYDPTAATWSPTGAMASGRFYHSETLLLSGKVLVAGGSGGSGFLSSSLLYDPAAGTWSASGSMASTRQFQTATRLPSGKVLMAGGWQGSLGISGAELFDPAPCCPTITLSPVWLPVASVAVSFSQRITASGEEEPFTYEILGGALPEGLTLEGSTGLLSGAPFAEGTFEFTVKATAATGCLGGISYTLNVAPPAIPGDGDGDGVVSIGEVQQSVNMFLGIQIPGNGVDCSGDGSVSIGEVQKAIQGFLGFSTSC